MTFSERLQADDRIRQVWGKSLSVLEQSSYLQWLVLYAKILTVGFQIKKSRAKVGGAHFFCIIGT